MRLLAVFSNPAKARGYIGTPRRREAIGIAADTHVRLGRKTVRRCLRKAQWTFQGNITWS